VAAGDINIFHARAIADQQITFVLEFSESLDIDKLTTALTVLEDVLLILSTVIQVQGSRFQRVRIPGYRLVLSIVSEPANRMQAMVRFIGASCDPEREPPAKLLLLRDHGQDTLYAPGVLIALSTCRDTLHLVVQGKGNKSNIYIISNKKKTVLTPERLSTPPSPTSVKLVKGAKYWDVTEIRSIPNSLLSLPPAPAPRGLFSSPPSAHPPIRYSPFANSPTR
jgi:NRPS condensation-like uncharacterized protein